MSLELRARAPPIFFFFFLLLLFGLPLISTVAIDLTYYHSVLRFVSMIGSRMLFLLVLPFV